MPRRRRPSRGCAGPTLTLDNKASIDFGYDIASDKSGRTYVGWISDHNDGNLRRVHLCTLPPGARRCKGGVQTVAGPGNSSNFGLRVLVTPGGLVSLVWEHTTVASENGPQGDEISVATSHAGGPLSAPADMATAPSFGTMLDATLGPNGSIWVASEESVLGGMQVRPGLSNAFVNLKTPYGVGTARIRFTGGTAVLAIERGGAITLPVAYARNHNGAWSGFTKLAHTWTGPAFLGLTNTSSGIRLVTSVNNADYFPVAWSFRGTSFGNPTPTGDHNSCAPSSHDLVADASGRAADVSTECQDVAIANLTDTRHAAVTRFSIHNGTFAGGSPQLTTTPRGTGWVVWSVESTVAQKLLVAPILLPGRIVTASATARGNRATVSGPASCLPPVDIAVGVKGKPARNWHVVSRTLHFGSSVLHSATLHGGTLTPGKFYTLTGTVKFANGGSHVTVTAKLKFRSCPKG